MVEEDVFSVIRLNEAEAFVLNQFFNLAYRHNSLTPNTEHSLVTGHGHRPIAPIPRAWNPAILHDPGQDASRNRGRQA
jgi:hypothetical protein